MPLTSSNDTENSSAGRVTLFDGTSLSQMSSPDADSYIGYTIDSSTTTYGLGRVRINIYNNRDDPFGSGNTFSHSVITIDESFTGSNVFIYTDSSTYRNADQLTIRLPQGWHSMAYGDDGHRTPNTGHLGDYHDVDLYAINKSVKVIDANGDFRFGLDVFGFENQANNKGIEQVCFTKGAMVLCENEERRPIETLCEGDLVWTKDHGLQPIRWIGSTLVTASTLKQFPNRRPIRIEANTFGNHDTLTVSQQHRMLVASLVLEGFFDRPEVLVPAKHLLNGDTITIVDDGQDVEYFHIMFDAHEILDVDGALSESYQPGEWSLSRMRRETRDEILALFPEIELAPNTAMCSARRSLSASEARVIGL